MTNLARKGPKKVWEGYKTMRVPIEIFDYVKKCMERRKQEYLAEQEGRELSEDELPHSDSYSIPGGTSKDEIKNLVKAAIREELGQGGKISSGTNIPVTKMTSKEQVLHLLKQHPNTPLTTTWISDELDLANSTARQATRELAEENDNIIKRPGRPNKFIYQKDQ